MRLTIKLLILIPLLFIFACKYSEKIRDGQTAYERKQYAEAVKLFGKEFTKNKGSDKARTAFFIGRSYLQINESEKATEWFKKAWDLNYGAAAMYQYARTMKQLERYKEAAEAFKSYGREAGEMRRVQAEIKACEQAAQWLADAPDNEFQLQKRSFNSPVSDYAPAFYDQQIIFTSDRNVAEGDDIYKWTGKDFSDLFIVNETGNVVTFSELNSEYNEGTITFNSTYTTAYFTRCGSDKKDGTDYCKIVFSKKDREGNWTKPKVCGFVTDKANYAHPYLADDDKTLYFSSDVNGFGGADIFKVVRTERGWSRPNNLGDAVNTPKDEKFPFRYKDTLYFASDGHTGMGGLDIFKVKKVKGTWRDTKNLRAPMNSGEDDFGLILREKTEGNTRQIEGYLSSTRKGGEGKDDIYYFTKKYIAPPPPPPIDTIIPPPIDTVIPPPEIVYTFNLEGTVLVKQYANDDPNSNIIDSLPAQNARVNISFLNKNKTTTADEFGKFKLELDEEADYFFLASKEGYLNNSARLSTKGEKDENEANKNFEVTIVLDKIFKDKEITLENIYYDYDKWNIRPDAEPSLNLLIKVLNENPTIRIQLSSHTDCRGKDDYNRDLSAKRAQSAVNYLIVNGIEASRLYAQGYGEERPDIDCDCTKCTEDEHQANRRTTFKVVE